MAERWDVIIVGARCAGATLATLLAKRGVRTLVLEASSRGTNMPMSTHLVMPPGMAVLDRIGLGARVRAVTPASARLRFALDDVAVRVGFEPLEAPYCVRRSTLDPWLQDTAEAAGAELRFRHRVVDLVRTAEQVSGVIVNTPSGTSALHAALVIGADGPHSTIAELTGVEEYMVSENERAGYVSYYPAPSSWTADWDTTLEHRGRELRYVFRADGDQVLLVYTTAREEVLGWGADRRERLRASLAGSPTTAALCEGKEQIGASVGYLKGKFFYRRPVGPGFALVGDAGHFKDFVTGQGMADAFLDAERMATAVLDGRDEAFAHYWRLRDVETLPLHFEAIRQGKIGHNSPFMRVVLAGIAEDETLTKRLQLSFLRELSPADVVPTSALLGILGRSLLRARFAALPGFLQTGKQLAAEARELEARQALLATAQDMLQRAPAHSAGIQEHAA